MNNWGRKSSFLAFLYWADCSFCCWCCQSWVTSEFPAGFWLSGAALALFPSPVALKNSLWQVFWFFFWLWSATSRSFPWDISAGRFRGVWTRGFWSAWSAINLFHSPCTLRVTAGSSSVPFTALVLLSGSHQKIMGPWHLFGELAQYLLTQCSFSSSGLSGYLWQLLKDSWCGFSLQKLEPWSWVFLKIAAVLSALLKSWKLSSSWENLSC